MLLRKLGMNTQRLAVACQMIHCVLIILFVVMLIIDCQVNVLADNEHVHEKNEALGSDNKPKNQEAIKENIEQKNSSVKTSNISLSKKDIYKAGFQLKRVQQIAAAKQLLKMEDYAKKYKMVTMILEKIFQILSSSKITITQSSYVPGQNFPESQKELDALAHIVENTAFFGDILLRIPDITHKIYQSKNEWRILVHWSVGFCNETGVFDGPNDKVLSLVAQELNLVERDPNYSNPYKAEFQQNLEKSTKNNKVQTKQQNKRKSKKTKRPRLSRTDL